MGMPTYPNGHQERHTSLLSGDSRKTPAWDLCGRREKLLSLGLKLLREMMASGEYVKE